MKPSETFWSGKKVLITGGASFIWSSKKLLGWEPEVPFREGLRRTIDWYYKTKDRAQVQTILKPVLTER
jgi:hypothetical protein